MVVLKNTIIGVLLATVISPLIFWMDVVAPFVLPKALFLRSLIEVAVFGALIYSVGKLVAQPVQSIRQIGEGLRRLVLNPLSFALGLYLISLAFSTILAADKFWAFWGPIERSDGFWGMLHFYAFMILGGVFFQRKHWLLYFKLSVVVGGVVAIRAFIEYFGFLGVTQIIRPYSFAGNPAYLATQMLFLLAFSALVFVETKQVGEIRSWHRLSRYSLPLFGALFLVTIFLAKTRGVFLGGAVGLLMFLLYLATRKQSENTVHFSRFTVRSIAVLALVTLAIGGVGLFMTRDLSVWQSIPGIDRIVSTSVFEAQDASAQLRLKVWALSWDAFKARPIFGWGLENYIVAFQQYYDPDLAIYGELWFDRAHNKLFDVLVMQGVFGLFAYMAIFGAAGFQIITFKKGPKSLLFALLIAYFVQNLLFTDHLISYLFFFAFLGYVFRLSLDEKKLNGESSLLSTLFASKSPNTFFSYPLIATTIMLVPLLFTSLYTWNWVPFNQARFYFGANEKKSVNEMVSTLSGAMKPYNFSQVGIRTSAIDDVYMPQFFYNDPNRMNAQNDALGSVLINGMQDVIYRHPAYEVRYYTRLVEMMNGYARSDATYYAKAEPVIRSAIKIAPRHQELHYHLAFNLAGQGRFDEAIRASQYAVSLSPTVLTSHLKLGFIYEVAGQHGNAQQEIKKMEQIDPALKILSEGDRATLQYLYQSWGMTEKFAD